MIGSLRGVLIERTTDEIMVEVAGVGYRVSVSPTTSVTLGELGESVFVHIHHHFREDDQTLYGFTTREERICFEAVISAHGVGPALGLAILSVHGPVALAQILATDDLDALCLVPGIGKKTATRLLVELKSKLDLGDVDLRAVQGTATPGRRNDLDDVREALAGLGYSGDEIHHAVSALPTEGDVSSLLKAALQSLATRT
jgi:holliday junction DNA helicase RuvA